MLPEDLPWRRVPFPPRWLVRPRGSRTGLGNCFAPDCHLDVPLWWRSPKICIYLSLDAVNSATVDRIWVATPPVLYRLLRHTPRADREGARPGGARSPRSPHEVRSRGTPSQARCRIADAARPGRPHER